MVFGSFWFKFGAKRKFLKGGDGLGLSYLRQGELRRREKPQKSKSETPHKAKMKCHKKQKFY